jgi:hypothetical protein
MPVVRQHAIGTACVIWGQEGHLSEREREKKVYLWGEKTNGL